MRGQEPGEEVGTNVQNFKFLKVLELCELD
jgi:hypothetical protein